MTTKLSTQAMASGISLDVKNILYSKYSKLEILNQINQQRLPLKFPEKET